MPLWSVLLVAAVSAAADSATDDAPRIAADDVCGTTCAGFLAGGEKADDVARSAHAMITLVVMVLKRVIFLLAAETVAPLDLMARRQEAVQAEKK